VCSSDESEATATGTSPGTVEPNCSFETQEGTESTVQSLSCAQSSFPTSALLTSVAAWLQAEVLSGRVRTPVVGVELEQAAAHGSASQKPRFTSASVGRRGTGRAVADVAAVVVRLELAIRQAVGGLEGNAAELADSCVDLELTALEEAADFVRAEVAADAYRTGCGG
jgi:hypothetical protein